MLNYYLSPLFANASSDIITHLRLDVIDDQKPASNQFEFCVMLSKDMANDLKSALEALMQQFNAQSIIDEQEPTEKEVDVVHNEYLALTKPAVFGNVHARIEHDGAYFIAVSFTTMGNFCWTINSMLLVPSVIDKINEALTLKNKPVPSPA